MRAASVRLTAWKLSFDTLLPMPNQFAAANAHHLATPFPGPQPWEAPDPLPVMRRELKLLLIEVNVLRVEVQQLREMEREARNTEECLSASLKRLMESRDHWRREAERLRALIAQVPPWSLFWWSCVDAFKAWRKPGDRGLHCA
jgi:FtsZ-binding cell division protein ZapB